MNAELAEILDLGLCSERCPPLLERYCVFSVRY